MIKKLSILGTLILLCLSSCTKEDDRLIPGSGPVTVAVGIGNNGGSGMDITRSAINPDGISFHWEESDNIALWALSSIGKYALSCQKFSRVGDVGEEAIFTTTIAEQMPDGQYSYYASSPFPVSATGLSAKFTIPSAQDGTLSGADIMVGGPVPYGPLGKYVPGGAAGMKMNLRHLVHVFKFYLPYGSDGIEGEPVKRIEVSMPENVCGTLSTDVSDPEATSVLSEGTSSFVLNLSEPLTPSSEGGRNYACAAVAPFSYEGSVPMRVSLFSDHYMAYADDINVSGRSFMPGHATPVRISIKSTQETYRLCFRLDGNFIGEDVRKITLTAPDGCTFGDDGAKTYIYEPGGAVSVGTELEFVFRSEDGLRAFSGKNVNVVYDSDHIIAGQTIPVSIGASTHYVEESMVAPYLLVEDFSSVPSFSSDDVYKTSSAGSMSPYSFLNGWSGGRIGSSSGNMVRLACRRESGFWVEALYDSRMESAPVARIKSPVDLVVSFDYGADNEYLDGDGNLGQTISVGYVESTEAYKSGSDAGTYDGSSSIHISTDEYCNSWETPYHASLRVPSVPAGQTVRISWKSHMDSDRSFAGNATAWFYLDNVKVQVAK